MAAADWTEGIVVLWYKYPNGATSDSETPVIVQSELSELSAKPLAPSLKTWRTNVRRILL